MGLTVRKFSKSPPKVYVMGYDSDARRRAGLIMELRYGYGLTPTQIRDMYGVPKTTIFRALKLYKAKQSSRNLTMTILSKV